MPRWQLEAGFLKGVGQQRGGLVFLVSRLSPLPDLFRQLPRLGLALFDRGVEIGRLGMERSREEQPVRRSGRMASTGESCCVLWFGAVQTHRRKYAVAAVVMASLIVFC